jgi:hypothetical protein
MMDNDMTDHILDLLGDSQDQGTTAPNSPALQNVSTLVTEWDKLGAELQKLEIAVKMRMLRRTEIEQVSLPAAMLEAGVSAFTTPSGRSVKIEQAVRGNIPAISTIEKAKGEERMLLNARRGSCFDVIRAKWPGLLKTELSLSLGKGEAGLATRIAASIRKEFKLTPSVDETVHPATLNAHFKELVELGKTEEIPAEPFALYIGPIAKIK